MVVTLKDRLGFIYAYIEYWVVDGKGCPKNNGYYLYIKDAWIHHSFRRKALRQLIKLVNDAEQTQKCQWVYWVRNKYRERQTPTYPKSRLAKLGVTNGIKES